MSDTRLLRSGETRLVRVRNDQRPWFCADRVSRERVDAEDRGKRMGVWNPIYLLVMSQASYRCSNPLWPQYQALSFAQAKSSAFRSKPSFVMW
jgi:hypothetical protein